MEVEELECVAYLNKRVRRRAKKKRNISNISFNFRSFN